MMFRFLFIFIFISSCQKIDLIPPPEYTPSAVESKKIIVSKVSIPIEIDLEKHLNLINEAVPSSFTDSKNICEGVSYKYSFLRKPISFLLHDNVVDFKLTGGLGLSVDYCPKCVSLFNKTSCVVPRVSGSCGENGEKKRTLELKLKTNLDINSNYRVVSKTNVKSVELLDPCRFSFLNINVSSFVEEIIKDELKNSCSLVDEELQNLNIKEIVDSSWVELQKGFSLGDFGFFYLNPTALSLNSLLFKNKSLYINLGLSISPQIIPEHRVLKTKSLPSLQKSADTSNIIRFYSDVFFLYDQLTPLINEQLRGKSFFIKNRYFHVDSLQIGSVDNQTILLKLCFSGNKKGVLYLTGKPVFTDSFETLQIQDIKFSIETKNVLLKSANWLLSNKILDYLNRYSHINLGSILNKEIDSFNKQFKDLSYDGVFVDPYVNELNPVDCFIDEKGLFFRVLVGGSLKLKIE